MRWIIFVMSILLIGAYGCGRKSDEVKRIMESPISYQSYVSPWAEFSRYKSWDWVPAPASEADETRTGDPQMRKAIEDGIAKQMDVRGYEQTTASPDLVLNYHVAVQTIDKDYIKKMYDGTYYPEYRMDFSGPKKAWKQWEEGSLIVLAFDTQAQQLVWQGIAMAEVTEEAPLDQRVERVNEAIKWVFTSLPGRPRWEMK